VQFSRNDIYKIIIEEYIKEQGLVERQDIEDLLKSIMGAEKYCERYPEKCQPPEDGRGGDTASMPKPMKPKPLSSLETMPFGPSDIPSDDAPERHVSGFQDRAGPDDEPSGDVESRIVSLLSKLEPEEAMDMVYDIVQKNYPQFMDTGRGKKIKGFFPDQSELQEAILEILSEYGF
tara:strand:- start:1602 stop:2129 length:528 start_codon:yes stop_codon:yes gene_type:complete